VGANQRFANRARRAAMSSAAGNPIGCSSEPTTIPIASQEMRESVLTLANGDRLRVRLKPMNVQRRGYLDPAGNPIYDVQCVIEIAINDGPYPSENIPAIARSPNG
jgi:hypothetical protein